MTLQGWFQIAIFAAIIFALTKPVGLYLYRVFEGKPLLPRLERAIYRICGVDAEREQNWKQYTVAMLLFSAVGVLVSYVLLRIQHVLPLSQMASLAWHNFLSAGTGIGIALAVARGITRRPGPDGPKTLGNFWVDLTRSLIYVLIPVSIVAALVLVSQGAVQTLGAFGDATTLEGAKQTIPLAPLASQEAIKMFGTNGGGIFNANSAHPFENPNGLSNLIEMLLLFLIPAGLTYTYGKMARDTKQGWAIFGAMAVLFLVGVTVAYGAEVGNMEGKEIRFGIANSALFATITTDASCGAVNAMHDSFTPLGGLVPLVNIQLGEVIFGGVGAGLYGMLVFVVLSVFIAGLMVGRTPELLGKKIEAREMKMAMLYVLIFPLLILGLSAWAAVVPYGTSALNNAGPHGLSEILYAFSSATGNNGSAFAGLSANVPFWNVVLGLAMLFGRFFMIIPIMAIAGSMVGKKTVPPSPGTFPTNGVLFTFLLISVIVIVGALTFFPALSLGPIVEHFVAAAGKAY